MPRSLKTLLPYIEFTFIYKQWILLKLDYFHVDFKVYQIQHLCKIFANLT